MVRFILVATALFSIQSFSAPAQGLTLDRISAAVEFGEESKPLYPRRYWKQGSETYEDMLHNLRVMTNEQGVIAGSFAIEGDTLFFVPEKHFEKVVLGKLSDQRIRDSQSPEWSVIPIQYESTVEYRIVSDAPCLVVPVLTPKCPASVVP